VVAGDHKQQVIEVMGDAAGQLPDSLHLLGLRQASLALPQRLLDMLAIAEIMDHASEVAPAIGGELADGQVEWKGGAILAPAPHFSATASFVTVAITTAAAVACLGRVEGWREPPLASLPLIFAGQQAVEGLLWLTLPIDPDGAAASLLTLFFLLCAQVLWPAFAPMASLLVEPDQKRRQLMLICAVIGAGVAAFFLWSIFMYPHTASIRGGHIAYMGEPRAS
jgi:hypothetical protein